MTVLPNHIGTGEFWLLSIFAFITVVGGDCLLSNLTSSPNSNFCFGENENRERLLFYLTCIFSVSLLSFCLWNQIKPHHVSQTVPGPPRTPGLGCLPYALKRWDYWPTVVIKLSEHYNQTWGGPFPNFGGLGGAVFFLVDEKCIKHILYDSFDSYEKGDAFRSCLSDFLGSGIFAADGELWQHHRKLASHHFTRSLLKQSLEINKSKLDQVIEFLTEAAESKDDSVDMQDLFFRMTIDAISSIAFGVELGSIRRKRQHAFALAFDEAQALCHDRFIDPTFRIKRFFQLTHAERRIAACIKIMNDFTDRIIQSKRRTSEQGHKLGPDLISRYIENAVKHNQDLPSNQELHDIIMNFVIAGRDTTACALSWTWYELSKKAEVVDKIIKEVKEVCGSGSTAEYTYDTIGKLRYTHAVVMEALRLHPSVPGDCKYAVKDDVLPDGTFIPKGSMVNYYPYFMGQSKRIWGDDATEFKPERFLNKKEPNMFLHPVFNAGYRLCLGKPMAIMNMKLTLAMLLPRFEFEDVQGHNGAYKWTLVMSMRNGFPMKIKIRANHAERLSA